MEEVTDLKKKKKAEKSVENLGPSSGVIRKTNKKLRR